jgi:transposase
MDRRPRVTRRANALVLLDDGWNCQDVADAFLLNDDTIRGWFKLFEQRGIEGITSFEVGGSAGFLSAAQEEALQAFVSATLPRSTRQIGAWIEHECGLVYESRSGLIALLHRLGLEYHAKLVREWLARPGCRIKLHFIPPPDQVRGRPYCPHLNPIERLWGLMHGNVTHNKCSATCTQFADATLGFLREKVPRNWADLCASVTDNFRIINPKDFRVMT